MCSFYFPPSCSSTDACVELKLLLILIGSVLGPQLFEIYTNICNARKLTHRATNVRNQKQFRFRTFPYPSGEKYISNLKTRFPTTKTNLELIHLKTYASHLSPSTPILIKIMSKMDGRYSRGRKISEIKRSAFAFRLD